MVILTYEVIIIERKETSRILYLDILRIVSIFAVVVLHVAAPFVENMYANGVEAWWAGNIIDSATRWCVPVLIMISGKLMLDNNREIKVIDFLKKRLSKILIPLIFWSFVYFIWSNRYNLEWNLDLFMTFGKDLYTDNIFIHLWYLYMILGLYLITPIIKVYINNVENSSVFYFIVIWFIANGVIEFLEKFTELRVGFNLSFFHWSIGYYVLGIFLDRQKLSRSVVIILYLLGLCGLAVTIAATYIFTKNNDENFVPHFYSYFAPNVIFMSISIFLLFKRINWNKIIVKNSFMYRLILNISNASFGIYLVHMFVLDITYVNEITLNPILDIPLISIIVYLVSFFIVSIAQKIKLLEVTVHS